MQAVFTLMFSTDLTLDWVVGEGEYTPGVKLMRSNSVISWQISLYLSFLLCYCLFEGLSPLHTLRRIFSLCVLCTILSPPFPHSELLFNLSSRNLANSCFIALFKIRASGYSPFTYKTDSQIILLKK